MYQRTIKTNPEIAQKPNKPNLIVGCVYRHPSSDIEKFTMDISDHLPFFLRLIISLLKRIEGENISEIFQIFIKTSM